MTCPCCRKRVLKVNRSARWTLFVHRIARTARAEVFELRGCWVEAREVRHGQGGA